jgi:hypothetical protein
MAKAGRGDDQYMVRFPEGLRARIKEAAERNSRSMNTEIIEKIELGLKVEDEHRDLSAFFVQHEDLEKRYFQLDRESRAQELEIQKLQKDLAVANATLTERNAAEGLDRVLDEITSMVGQVKKFQDEDAEALREVTEIQSYLQGDAVCLQAELGDDPYRPSAIRPILLSAVAEKLAAAIDQRTYLLMRVILKLSSSARKHQEAAVLAKSMRHQINGMNFTDDVLDAFLREVDGLATELHAADFYDHMVDLIKGTDDDLRKTYQQALDALMPKLFKGWPDDWY